MLGKMPAVTALTAVFTVVAGALPCAAQGASSTAQAAEAEASRFNAWRDRFRATALKEGIPHDVFEKALGGVRPDPTVHEKNEDQPEFTRPVWEYLDGALSDSRIRNGRKMLRRHASLLEKAERKWGVPRHVLVAIWGMETSYGALLGKHNVFEALATLSYRGDRTGYGEQQLLAALRLLADGHKPAEAMKGSWAGAVGHTQFVPTTYLKYAVDGDKDGRRDLWDSLSDVFHSTAHYLKKSGFDPNLKWGREAFLPDDFDYALAGYDITKTLGEWRELGIRMANGSLVPDMDIKASVLVPAGHRGPAFLIYENFHAILAYNHSTSYALAIGLLSDRLRGGPSLKTEWPRHVQPLRRAERLEIQRRLKALGYEVTKVDGVLGRETRKAIRAFQKDRGEVADGYATPDLLAALRSAGPAETASAEPAAEDGTTDGQDAPQAAETAMMDASEAGPEGAAAGAGSDADRAEGVAQTAAEEPLAVAAADETAAGPAGEETVTEPGANESVTEPGANESVTEAAADEAVAEAEPTPAAAASET
ncbi:MAG: lytic murein transglycosylase, partial [Alphaproteobacteria bacterium]